MENLIRKSQLYIRNRHSLALLVALFLILDSLVFILPYYLRGFKNPVGWDTAWYIRNMRLIDEQGLYKFFLETHEINLFCILEYLFASAFNVSFRLTETILPIVISLLFTLVNFQIVKRFTGSRKLSLVAMAFTIIDYNIVRMATDLHRNLFCLLLCEVAIFLILPRFLKYSNKKDYFVFVTLMTMAGLSQMETFAITVFVLFTLLLLYIRKKSFKTAKLLLLCLLTPTLIVLVCEISFLPIFVQEHIVFNPSKWWYRQNFVAEPWCYLVSFGAGLIPLYAAGMYDLTKKTSRTSENHQYLLIFLWNVIVAACSFLPLFGVRIPGWRFLLLTTVAPVAALGFSRLFLEKKSFSKRKALILVVLVAISLCTIILSQIESYKPWISEDVYGKMVLINNANRNKSNVIFVICFDYGWRTFESASLYRNWIYAVVGTRTNIYFGDVNCLTKLQPTDFENPFLNSTSHVFWNELEDFTLDNARIYTIENWYKNPLNETYLMEVEPGIYFMELD